jgi:hypothetical protein
VNDTELPRPEVPSPFASPGWLQGAPREPRWFPPACLRTRLGWGRCRSLGHRGGDATQHVIRSHSRTLESSQRDRGSVTRPAERRLIRRSDRASRARFRTERDPPVKSVEPDSPFIVTQGCTRVGSVAEVRVASTVTSAVPLAENVSSRGSGASESRVRVGTFACAKREPP